MTGCHDYECAESARAEERTIVPVDLTLAHAYIPALSCIMRSSIMIFVVSRPWATMSIPIHVLLCLFLFADRVIRNENIFDSNSLMSTIAASSLLNTFRADGTLSQGMVVSDNWALGCRIIYCAASVLLLLNYDVGVAVVDSTSKGRLGKIVSRPFTALLHCALLSFVLQTPLSADSVGTHSVGTRSFAFMLLSLCW